ncbi:hypothetical protein OHR68_41780 [Spirillospora sp. NBC_00431]
MGDNPWAWRDGHNPYRRTPFQVLALAPDLSGRAAIQRHIRRRRRRIERRPDRYRLYGSSLSVAEVNAAEDQIKDPAGRLLALLLTHRPEPREAPDLAGIAARAAALVPAAGEPPVPALNPAALARLAPAPAPRRRTFRDGGTDD